MFEILLIAYLAYRNSVRAKLKDENPVKWGVMTAVAYLIGMFLGVFIVVLTFCKNAINLDQFSALDSKSRDAATQQLMQLFSANPLHLITVELFGIGGYLLVRYILDKKPGKKQPEIHWMDRMGEQ